MDARPSVMALEARQRVGAVVGLGFLDARDMPQRMPGGTNDRDPAAMAPQRTGESRRQWPPLAGRQRNNGLIHGDDFTLQLHQHSGKGLLF